MGGRPRGVRPRVRHRQARIHRDAIHPDEPILIVDDVLATGGTRSRHGALVEALGGNVVGIGVMIELEALGGREQLAATGWRVSRDTEETMATVDRVLPWRRHHETAAASELVPLLRSYRSYHPKARIDTINRAYHTAAEAHRNQTLEWRELHQPPARRREDRRRHRPRRGLARRGLLHDAVEDTEITLQDVRDQFGEEVAWIVDGVTKLERIQFDSARPNRRRRCARCSSRMAKDLRVLVIKLADRLHNMRTLGGMAPEKQRRIAQETIDIYAPWRTASASRRSSSSSKISRSRRCTRSGTPNSTTWSPPAVPNETRTSRKRLPRSRSDSTNSASRARSPAVASTSGASTKRWS
ncbi:MAG: HD domain-containing protein [Ilumatobacteraceae bacterium]